MTAWFEDIVVNIINISPIRKKDNPVIFYKYKPGRLKIPHLQLAYILHQLIFFWPHIERVVS